MQECKNPRMQESENLSQPLPREEDAGVSDEVEDANIDESSNSTTQIDESWKDIVLKLRCCCSRTKLFRVNHNVFVNLVLSFLYGISNSLWNGTAFAAYLKQLGHNRNGPVGAIEAVSGLASLVTALPVGFLADKIGRSRVIAAGGLLLFCTSILQIFVLEWSSSGAHNQDTILWLMGVIMAFWGVGDGIVNGPASALYADSTPEGKRSEFYNYLFVTYLSASSIGPLVSIILFQRLGDVWDLSHLRIVIYVGLAIEVINSFLMMFFDDTKALDETSEHNEESSAYDTSLGEQSQTPESDRTEDQRDQQRCCIYNKKWIPYIIFFNGLIFAIGSGMTVKFFPLFFKDEVRLSPSQVQIVYCIVPIVMAITATIGSKLAGSGFGRVQTMLLFWCLGVSLLFSMVIFKRYLDEHPFTLVPVYVLRTSLVNATYPLTQSVLMDFVPKDERARWKSLDSVAMFGWCGSAFLGGMIADKYDYTHTFLITAIVQSIGTAVGALLLPLVPRNEGGEDEGMVDDEGREHSSIGSASIGGDSNNASLREPLLSSN